MTCEEISGIGPENEGDKGGKREKAKKMKKESEITRGQEKRGLLCMCINRVYDEVSFFVLCAVTRG